MGRDVYRQESEFMGKETGGGAKIKRRSRLAEGGHRTGEGVLYAGEGFSGERGWVGWYYIL